MSSTDLDPGYLVTHDDPHHANVELADREAKMRALIGRAVVTDGDVAIVTRAYSPEVVNVVRLEDLRPMMSVQSFVVLPVLPFTCAVFYRAPSGVQYVALVTRIETELVDLLVLSDGYVDLGAGPGVPVARAFVPHGQGHECWQTELDA